MCCLSRERCRRESWSEGMSPWIGEVNGELDVVWMVASIIPLIMGTATFREQDSSYYSRYGSHDGEDAKTCNEPKPRASRMTRRRNLWCRVLSR